MEHLKEVEMKSPARKYNYRPSERVQKVAHELDCLRPLRQSENVLLQRVLVFHAGEDVAVSFVTNCGVTNVTLPPRMAVEVASMLQKATKPRFVGATLECD